MDVLVRLTVVVDVREAAEVARFADGPVQGGGLEVDFGDDFVDKLEWFTPHTVPLVDHGDDRQSAGFADAEEFEGLGLEALGGVDKHDCGIDRGEHTVGVLGEIRVTWGVHEIDHVRFTVVALWRVFEL